MNHKRKIAIALALLVSLTVFSAVPASVQAGRPSTSGAEWTIMVYMDGDNNLDPFSALDIEEMKAVGSTSKINILVLWDRYDAPAYLYKVNLNSLTTVTGMKVNGKDVNGQEVYMADWHVLEAFVDFGKIKFPANHYMVVVWDHCDAYGLCCVDEHWDPTYVPSVERMTLAQVQDALAGFGRLDILAYDACLAGMVEIAYEFSVMPAEKGLDLRYLVGTEGYVPDNGYPYNTILEKLNGKIDLGDPAVVAKLICDEYARAYSTKGQYSGESNANLSAILISESDDAIPILADLNAELRARLALSYDYWHKLISRARGDANLPWSENGWEQRVDIIMYLKSLAASTKDAAVKSLASAAAIELTQSTYVANTQSMASAGAYGLAVYFPVSYSCLGSSNAGWYVQEDYPIIFKFAGDAGWMSFLMSYWNMK
ncbi:MAG: clostripain-related cysteine peptidase [Thermoplasmata archaeon]